MAGSTGKMTKAAIRERGPRMVLYKIALGGAFTSRRSASMLVVARLGISPFSNKAIDCNLRILARSYSKSYLLRVAQGNRS